MEEQEKFYFENLDVYVAAKHFVSSVYKVTSQFPKSEMFGLTSQVRRAAVSVVSNIAEGSSRTQKELRHFLTIARGSVFECVSQFGIAQELQYLQKVQYDELYSDCIKLSKMLNGFIQKLT